MERQAELGFEIRAIPGFAVLDQAGDLHEGHWSVIPYPFPQAMRIHLTSVAKFGGFPCSNSPMRKTLAANQRAA